MNKVIKVIASMAMVSLLTVGTLSNNDIKTNENMEVAKSSVIYLHATDGEDTSGNGTPADESATSVEDYVTKNVRVSSSGKLTCQAAWLSKWVTLEPTDCTIATVDGKPVYLVGGNKKLDQFTDRVEKSIRGEQRVEDMGNIGNEVGLEPDIQGATQAMSGFSGIISILLGILVVIISVGMTIFSALDICYIAFPVFRNKCEESKDTGGVMKSKSGDLRFITDDAQYAISQGTVENGKSPWTLYFKKRIMSYILLAIVLFILLTGNISLITDLALKVIQGIMDVLQGLAG